MSLRLEMLQVARLAPDVLGESSELVADFLKRQQNPDGGFRGRTAASDLYYTVFGIDALIALRAEPDRLALQKFLVQFGDGELLDLVHLCCLARCWKAADPGDAIATRVRDAVLRRLQAHRTCDGGFNPDGGAANATVYGCFLAAGAYQDIEAPLPQPEALVQAVKLLEAEPGAWANDRIVRMGAVPATAAAATLLRNLGFPVSGAAGQWLLKQAHPQGGFVALPGSPVPDLLSTATALHALSCLEVDFSFLKESCLDFIDSLWTNEGGFYGHWEDDALDCEYTFYGLLALGHLSV